MGKTKLDETCIFKSALKCNSFDVAIGIKIPFFRVLITIEPGRSLLQFVTTNCLITYWFLEFCLTYCNVFVNADKNAHHYDRTLVIKAN